MTVADSYANFVLFKAPGGDGPALWNQLLERGVLIRDVGLNGHLRVTAGTPEETTAFLEAMEDLDDVSDDLAFAHRLADAADAVTLAGFGGAFTVSTKSDDTPVTEIDRAAERAVRDLIAAHRPSDAVHGEEHADTGDSGRRWIIDPIDGTKNFIRGVPVWASLISLSIEDRVEVAVVSAPSLSRRWWAQRGYGAQMRWTDLGGAHEKDLRVSTVTDIAHASLSQPSIPGWAQLHKHAAFLELHERTWRLSEASETSGRTCSSPKVQSTSRLNPKYLSTTWRRCHSSSKKPAGTFTNVSGVPGPDGGSVLASNTHLHVSSPRSPANSRPPT